MSSRTLRVAVAAILLAGALPATATVASGDTGLIVEHAYDGNGYAAWEFTAEAGDEIEFQGTTFSEDASMESVGVWFLDEAHDLEYAAILSHFYGPGNIAYASAGPAGNVASVADGPSAGGGFIGITSFQVPEDGTYHVVTLGAADGTNEGELRLLGPETVTITGKSSGDSFLAKPPSFQGTGASVAAETPQPNYVGAQGRILMDATYPVSVDGQLFSLFTGDTNSGELEMSIDTPTGTLDGQHSYFLHGEGAGDYTYRVDENVDTWDTEGVCQAYGPEFCTQPKISALGADVALP